MDYSTLNSLFNKASDFVQVKYRWAYAKTKHHFRTKKSRRQAVYFLLGALSFALFLGLINVNFQKQNLQASLVKRQQKLHQLQDNLKQLQAKKAESDQEIKQRDKSLQDTQKQINDLNQQLQSRNAQKSLLAQAASAVSPGVASADSNCVSGYSSGDLYLDKIIGYESGGNSCATNPGGCFGLLQACPGAPLRAACGGNPACQIAWFRANKTGGRSWAEVWQHELAFGWW